MDRREVAKIFRARLSQAMQRSEMNRTALARKVGIDRSTLSLLLSDDMDRLPRADTVAALASTLQISLDWLLGLSHEARIGADILLESLQITPSGPSPDDENLARWHQEARGYKIRYVPTTLPDLVKTEAVIEHEYRDFVAKSAGQIKLVAQDLLDYSQMPDTDMEICMPIQAITSFARKEALWEGLPAPARRQQIDRLVELSDELYPSLRIYLFDALTHYSVPLTVFGPLRAVIYLGQMYFVFNTTEHIRVLSRHFDQLIRGAVVPAEQVPSYLRTLKKEIK
ncbi:MAG: helix-turn-helix transcriptional regulator [Alphaproteobacteria bacterium]